MDQQLKTASAKDEDVVEEALLTIVREDCSSLSL